jgi:hypothetical protein
LTGAERKGPQTEKHGLRYPPSTGRTVTGGCVDEAAEILQVAPVTVMRDWKLAKAWILRELTPAAKK